MVDFHSHILPGMDDGSKSVEESLEMLRLAREQGVRRIVATPHFYPRRDTPEHFLRKRSQAERLLRRAMQGREELPALTMGAEVAYFRGIGQSEAMEELTLRGTPYLLVEMPPSPWTEGMYEELQALHERGITPIIAHVDRYIGPLRSYGIPARLEKLPVLVQANAEFFLRRSTASMAMRMLKADRIHLLGSDCHNLTDRKPNLGDAAERIRHKLGREALVRLRRHERQVLGL